MQVPGAPLTRQCLELLAYIAYDRVGAVVEAAIRARTWGVLTESPTALEAHEVAAALANLPEVPLELVAAEAARRRQARCVPGWIGGLGGGCCRVRAPRGEMRE
jgi:hypothetical protein